MNDVKSLSVHRDLRNALIELTLISHAPTPAYDSDGRGSSEEIGGRRPRGGNEDRPPRGASHEERMAWFSSYQRKTVDYFRRQVAECATEAELVAVLSECRTVIKAWKKAPALPPGQEPEYGSPRWKQWVADSPLDGGELARKFQVTRQYIHQIRQQYGRSAA